MYLKYYNFRREPFQITPDPEFLFLSPSHKEAMASIIYGIEGKKGFIAIVGGVGVGKTTILRSYLEKIDRNTAKIIYIFNANLSFKSLLQTIYQELGIVPRTDDIFLMVNQLNEVLIEHYKKGNTVVLIIDEAQNMPVETLENLRMLSNLETATDKLIQIVLIGQPEFNDKLDLYELRQLKQRIAIRTTILPLTRIESERYIRHRLSKVMLRDDPVLTQWAVKEIVRYSKGIPRVINIVCDNAFITGYGYQKKPVTARIVREICADFDSNKNKEHEEKTEYFFRWKTAAAIAVVFATIGAFWLSPYRDGTWDRLLAQVRQLREEPSSSRPADEARTPDATSDPAVLSASAAAPPGAPVSAPLEAAAQPGPETTALAASETGAARTDAGREAAASGSPVVTQVASQPLSSNPSALSPGKQGPVVVEKGDTLSRLIIDKYGFYDKDLLQKVKNENPDIKDVNRIYVGDKIVLPDSAKRSARRR
jgi:general secretion pathway protein A